jgi:hypothetical protein
LIHADVAEAQRACCEGQFRGLCAAVRERFSIPVIAMFFNNFIDNA